MAVSTLVASAARTTSSASSAFSPNKNAVINLFVSVTAASGTTPTLDFTVEWSHDASNWFVPQAADSFTQITTTGKAVKQFVVKAPYFRLVWTVAGTTPSFTFSATIHTPITYVKLT